MRKWIFIPLLLIASMKAAQTAQANIGEAAVLFLVIPNSARANAMGNCTITMVDAQSGAYNPGAMGILHLNKLAARHFPNTTSWLPTLADDLRVRSYNFSDGVSWKLLTGKGGRFDASASFGFGRHELDLGSQIFVDEFGNILGNLETNEEVDYYTGSLAFQYYVKFGVGFTRKHIQSNLGFSGPGPQLSQATAKAKAWDLGLYAELPLFEQRPRPLDSVESGHVSLTFELTPALAYVNVNNGDDISYSDVSQADPLPHMQQFGASLYGAARKGPATAVSLRLAWQMGQDLIGSDHQTTQGGGAEIGFLGAMYFRMGRYVDEDGAIHMDTFGYGLSLAGLLSWTGVFWDHGKGSPVMRYLRDHLDLTYDYAKYNEDDKGPVDGTSFTGVSFSF